MPDSIFHDPTRLAELTVEPLKSYLAERDKLPLPTAEEIARWDLSESELDRCAKEFVLMAAIGTTVTVMRNKPAAFYEAFVRAMTPMLAAVMLGRPSVTEGQMLIGVIEQYIAHLEDDIVEFSYMYTDRVFPGNPHKVAIISTNVWKRAFDLMMLTMNASKQYFIQCMAAELAEGGAKSP